MPPILPSDWASIFEPRTALLEIFVRGTLVYLALFILLRVIPKREIGSLNVNNLLIIVLLADAIQNAMSGGYTSVTDGLLLVATLLFWSAAVDWITYHAPWLAKLIQPAPRLLIKNGRMLKRNMQEELITRAEMIEYLREQGVASPKDVKEAWIESDGQISIIKYKPDDDQKNPGKKKKQGV